MKFDGGEMFADRTRRWRNEPHSLCNEKSGISTPRIAPSTQGAATLGEFRLLRTNDLAPSLDSPGNHMVFPRTLHETAHKIDSHGLSIEGLYAKIEQWSGPGNGTTPECGMVRHNATTAYRRDASSWGLGTPGPGKFFFYTTCRFAACNARMPQRCGMLLKRRRHHRRSYPVMDAAPRSAVHRLRDQREHVVT